jgi:hypothetical protein
MPGKRVLQRRARRHAVLGRRALKKAVRHLVMRAVLQKRARRGGAGAV